MLSRRAIFLGVSMALAGARALAQPVFPSKALRIIVPFGAGGVADLTARAVGQRLSERLQQAVVIDNRPGAGGAVAGEWVARAEPDGHTLLLMSNATAVSASLFKSLPFNPRIDFAPISLLGVFDIAVVVPEQSAHKTLADLFAWARAHPGQLNIATIQVGSTQNLAAEWLKTQAQLQAQIVPYNGTPAVLQALRGGQVDVAIEILGPLRPHIAARAVRVLGVMGDQRPKDMPQVPTLRELPGLGHVQVSSWNALAAPAKTPRPIIERLHHELAAILQEPDMVQRLSNLQVRAQASSPAQLAALLERETLRWREVIERAGIPPQ